MSEAKFTKGPWVANFSSKNLIEVTLETGMCGGWRGTEYMCTTVFCGDGYDKVEVAKANANLIAAAPEMYRKLEHVAEFFDNLCEDDAANEIKALLAKSRGEHDNN